MKKTRILAALLCLMMVVCSLPMMASAKVSNELYNSIGVLMGRTSSQPVNDAAWLSMNFDFTDNFSQTDSITMPNGASYDNTNGLNMPKTTSATWIYFPSTLTSQGWSPLVFGAYYLRFKVDEGGLIEAQACAYYQHARSYVSISPTGVTVYTSKDGSTNTGEKNDFSTVSNLADYVPGTGWNDMVVVANGGSANAENGYSVYMKKSADTEFTKVATTAAYRGNGGWKSTGLSLHGHDSYISDAVMLEGTDTALAPVYDSIEEIVGGNVATAQNFVFDSNFGTNLTVKDSSSRVLGIVSPAGENYSDTNGLDLSAASEALTWQYWAFNGWQPFTNNGQNTAIMFTAKTTSTDNGVVQWRANSAYYRGYLNLNKNSVGIVSSGTVTTYSTIAPGDGWVDYLIVPHTTDLGYDLYMRSDSLTGGKWELKASCDDAWKHASNAFNNLGIQISGKVNMYKSVKLLSLTNAVAESETKPADATQLIYEETFETAPTYANQTQTNAAVANGVITLTGSQESGSGKFVLYNGEIPAGGYAEFKVKNASTESNYFFEDGAKRYALYDIKSYGEVSGSGLYISDGGNIWRTFRIVRNSDGTYSSYTKVDGDTNWLKLSTNSAGVTLKGDAKISISFHANANGTDKGVGVVDEIKIYAPVSAATLTLTDGYGTKVLTDGATVTYEESLRYIVNGASGKLLVVTYKGDDMLKAQIINAADGNDAFVDAKADGATKVKVFLWNNLTNLNRLTPAVTLNL